MSLQQIKHKHSWSRTVESINGLVKIRHKCILCKTSSIRIKEIKFREKHTFICCLACKHSMSFYHARKHRCMKLILMYQKNKERRKIELVV